MKFNIKTDSRKVKHGDIFVAVKTALGDGHDYIEKAIENGATTVVATSGSYSVNTIITNDTRKYLNEHLIKEYSNVIDEMTIIGTTGTNGKTTTSSLIYQAINLIDKKCGLIGTVGYFLNKEKVCYLPNSSPDICDTYEMLIDAYNKGYRYFSLECSSHGLYEGRLAGIKFDYAIFTNLTRDHLDFHKTYENYVEAKKILFQNLKPNGKAIVNNDDTYYSNFIVEHKTSTFGINNADFKIKILDMDLLKTDFKINDFQYRVSFFALHNIYNITPTIIILKDLGCSYDEIKEVLLKLELPSGRNENIKYNTNNIYIDYAHTPDGVEKAVSSVQKLTRGDTYTVFCCRGNRDIGRRSGMMKAACKYSTLAIVTNDHILSEDPLNVINDMIKDLEYENYEIILNRKEAIYRGIDLLKKDDSLLILGHGHEAVLIDETGKKVPFIETEIVNNYINSKKETLS